MGGAGRRTAVAAIFTAGLTAILVLLSHKQEHYSKRNLFNKSPNQMDRSKEARLDYKPANSTTNWVREIVMPSRMLGVVSSSAFNECPISNCVYKFTDQVAEMEKSDLIVIEFTSPLAGQEDILRNLPKRPPLLVYSHESPGYNRNKWTTDFNNYDGTVTYRMQSTAYFPYSIAVPRHARNRSSLMSRNYAKNKSKGAFAYVSNCNSIHYNRMAVMRQLSKYIDVDIYGSCTGNAPCARGDTDCEASIHKQYKFYLAFENSLCKEYITEKFWKSLASSGHYVPVVIGGVSIEDYRLVAPHNSFIHAYNFSSIAKLGEYLQILMKDDVAYNGYHAWKTEQKIINPNTQVGCDLCALAFNSSVLMKNHSERWADKWNDSKNCMTLTLK